MLLDEAIKIVRGSELGALADELASFLNPSARIVIRDGAVDPVSNSRLGGAPRLPRGIDWPVFDNSPILQKRIESLEERFKENPTAIALPKLADAMREELRRGPSPMTFLGELSLAEIHDSASLPGWPTGGRIIVFYSACQSWGIDPLEKGHCKVIHVEEGTELIDIEVPISHSKESQLLPRAVDFVREWTLPEALETGSGDVWTWQKPGPYSRLCLALMRSEKEGQRYHRVGGYPQAIQGDMTTTCQLVTNGIDCGKSVRLDDPSIQALLGGVDSWKLMLQIDTDEDRLGASWGDAGRVYFWVEAHRLTKADFSNAWAVLQCY